MNTKFEKKNNLHVTIIFLLIFNINFSQDLFDNILNNSQTVIELKDVFRAYYINHIITDQKETINLLLNEESNKELNDQLIIFINDCTSLKKFHFNDLTLNFYISKYLELTIKSYQIAKNKGFNSTEFKKDFENYRITTKKYMNYLASKYSTSHFVNLTEKAYWQTVDKSNYIKSKEYNDYRKLKKTNLKSSFNLLEKIVQKTIDFQEYSIYQIELADQYEKKSDSLENNASKLAIEKYKYILDKKKYSIYLFETWLKWRTVTQQHLGISKFSEIPNDKYNKMRKEVAYIILDYITKNDKDAMAINQFTLMATHDIVRRFGEYPYGNQNTIEYHQIFDEN